MDPDAAVDDDLDRGLWRDVGPYETTAELHAQTAATLRQLTNPGFARESSLILSAALSASSIHLSDLEQDTLTHVTATMTPTDAQVIAGWILRASSADHGIHVDHGIKFVLGS